MRKIILSMNLTLDGFVEGENGDLSWMSADDEEQWEEHFKMLETVDLFLLGHGMWAEYRDYWKETLRKKDPPKNELAYARFAEKTPHLIVSRTLRDPQWENAAVIGGDIEASIKKIKHSEGKDIQIVGGATLAASLISAGLVDEYRLIINPSIISRGKSFFQHTTGKINLELMRTKQLRNGALLIWYRQV